MEVGVTGGNPITYPDLATWQWEVATYLFLGGLVAGLMILGGALRLFRAGGFRRSLFIGDIVALPLLAAGMFLLWLDLANRWNVWRFFTTLQLTSAMSWGSWILLLSMVVLALRLLSRLPAPHETVATGKRSLWLKVRAIFRGIWRWLAALGSHFAGSRAWLDAITLVLGVGLGFYTGVLLSTIPARPLWNSAALAPLFLVSGLASAGAFLCLFIPREEHARLAPLSVLLCSVEIVLLAAYGVTQVIGSEASQRAGQLLLGGDFGLAFWGLVVVIGLLVPVSIEAYELWKRHLPIALGKLPPLLKLTGSIALRLIIVYAGLQTFV